jgi:hypothetical protein
MRCSASLRTASSTLSVACIFTTLWPLIRKTSETSMAASCDQTALGAFWTAIAREQSFDQLDGKEHQKVKRADDLVRPVGVFRPAVCTLQ